MFTDPTASPEEGPFRALPATTRAEILLLLRDTELQLRKRGPEAKQHHAAALKRILPVLAEHGLDRWADLFWADAERLIQIGDTPHARSQTHRLSHTGSRLTGAFDQYSQWHGAERVKETSALDAADRAVDRPVLSRRGAAGELRMTFWRKDVRGSFQYFHNLSPKAIHGLVKQTLGYLDQLARERPEELADIYLGLHGRPELLPASYRDVFSGLGGPMPGQSFATQMMQQLVQYRPETGITLNRDTQAIADTLARYSEHHGSDLSRHGRS